MRTPRKSADSTAEGLLYFADDWRIPKRYADLSGKMGKALRAVSDFWRTAVNLEFLKAIRLRTDRGATS